MSFFDLFWGQSRRAQRRRVRPGVESLEDREVPATFFVTTVADNGNFNNPTAGSLRAAIKAANSTATLDVIKFNIPGAGVHVIKPPKALPSITQQVTIDGYSQPGASLNTLATGNNAKLKIVLDGSNDPFLDNDGLAIKSKNVTVKGLVVSNFKGDGISMDRATNAFIAGCFIGTDVTGKLDRGNGGAGIRIEETTGASIGNAALGNHNIISGNTGYGVTITPRFQGVGSFNIHVQGNFIGTTATGLAALGNSLGGVKIEGGSGHVIGGKLAGQGNTIAFNAKAGVTVKAAVTNQILSNSIHHNGGLGIDLGGDGVTLNDPLDADSGANNLQNFPVLTSAVANAQGTVVKGTLHSKPNQTFRIELFSSPVADPSGFGEGQVFLGFVTVTTDAQGNASFTATLPKVAVGQVVTATATDGNFTGNTSEFSKAKAVKLG